MGVFGKVDTEALGCLCAALPTRDERAGAEARHKTAGRVIASDEFFGGLLLRRRNPLPSIVVEGDLDRTGREVNPGPAQRRKEEPKCKRGRKLQAAIKS